VKEKSIQDSPKLPGVWADVGVGTAMVVEAVAAGATAFKATAFYNLMYEGVLEGRAWDQVIAFTRRIGALGDAGALDEMEGVAGTAMGGVAVEESVSVMEILDAMTAVELASVVGAALIEVQAAAFLVYGMYLLIRNAKAKNDE